MPDREDSSGSDALGLGETIFNDAGTESYVDALTPRVSVGNLG